ncbi:hypothetical protein FIBSPDRAFT_855694, partial [Athelia psychrophila]
MSTSASGEDHIPLPDMSTSYSRIRDCAVAELQSRPDYSEDIISICDVRDPRRHRATFLDLIVETRISVSFTCAPLFLKNMLTVHHLPRSQSERIVRLC